VIVNLLFSFLYNLKPIGIVLYSTPSFELETGIDIAKQTKEFPFK